MKPIWIVLGLIGLYLYSKGQLGSSIQATFPVATTLLTDITGSVPQPNQKAPLQTSGDFNYAASHPAPPGMVWSRVGDITSTTFKLVPYVAPSVVY